MILVCGGRKYNDVEHINHKLFEICSERSTKPEDLFIVEGACHLGGADLHAYKWRTFYGIKGKRYPVDHALDGPWPRAGGKRNRRMYNDAQPQLVIAFPGGKGTSSMVYYAKSQGCEVIEILGRPEYIHAS